MKTIIKGNAELVKDYKYFECKKCGWVGKAEKDNMSITAISVKEIGQE